MAILEMRAEVPVTLAVKCVRHCRPVFICNRNGALISVKVPRITKQTRAAKVQQLNADWRAEKHGAVSR